MTVRFLMEVLNFSTLLESALTDYVLLNFLLTLSKPKVTVVKSTKKVSSNH